MIIFCNTFRVHFCELCEAICVVCCTFIWLKCSTGCLTIFRTGDLAKVWVSALRLQGPRCCDDTIQVHLAMEYRAIDTFLHPLATQHDGYRGGNNLAALCYQAIPHIASNPVGNAKPPGQPFRIRSRTVFITTVPSPYQIIKIQNQHILQCLGFDQILPHIQIYHCVPVRVC